MQITEVSLFKLHGTYRDPGFPPGDRQSQATDVYPEFNARGGITTTVTARYP